MSGVLSKTHQILQHTALSWPTTTPALEATNCPITRPARTLLLQLSWHRKVTITAHNPSQPNLPSIYDFPGNAGPAQDSDTAESPPAETRFPALPQPSMLCVTAMPHHKGTHLLWVSWRLKTLSIPSGDSTNTESKYN